MQSPCVADECRAIFDRRFLLEEGFGVLTRVGLHCAPAAHRTLGTYPQGTVRFAPGFFTSDAQIDAAIAGGRYLAAKKAGGR